MFKYWWCSENLDCAELFEWDGVSESKSCSICCSFKNKIGRTSSCSLSLRDERESQFRWSRNLGWPRVNGQHATSGRLRFEVLWQSEKNSISHEYLHLQLRRIQDITSSQLDKSQVPRTCCAKSQVPCDLRCQYHFWKHFYHLKFPSSSS